jgi:EPS-associated MarR family transcriptional regulator
VPKSCVHSMNKKNQASREEIRLRVMRLVDGEPNLSQRAIADRLGVSLGSVNYCVKALVEKGWVKVDNFRRSDNKLAYVYILTPRGAAARLLQTKIFLNNKLEEYKELKAEIIRLEAEVALDAADECNY